MKKILKLIKGLLVIVGVLLACVVVIVFLGARVMSKANKEYESNRTEISSQNGDKKAFIIYQPASSSDVCEKVIEGVAEGLADKGYDVSIDYCGKHIAADLSEYDLVIFGGATYAGHVSSVLIDTITNVNTYKENAKVLVFSTGMLDSEDEIDEAAGKVNSTVSGTKKFKASDKDITQLAKNWANQF